MPHRLEELIDNPDVGIGEIAAHLDALKAEQRWLEVRPLGRSAQRKLFHKAADAPPVTLEDFVPLEVAELVPVHHQGRNTLPLPGKHQQFQKRFCRPPDRSARLFGYNEGASRKWIGPGYFVALSTAGKPQWESRGGVVVDYFQAPDQEVPTAWPSVIPNQEGLQRFVFHRTRDFMRRVSSTVTIGAAYKDEKALDHYFLLCRQG